MTRAELRDLRVRAMGGEPVPHDVALGLINEVWGILEDGSLDDVSELGDGGHCWGCDDDSCMGGRNA